MKIISDHTHLTSDQKYRQNQEFSIWKQEFKKLH